MNNSVKQPRLGRRAAVILFALLALSSLLFFAQSAHAQSTAIYTIIDDATGGDCQAFGSWNQATRTCTLNRDIEIPNSPQAQVAIEIASNGITLDGNRHRLVDHGLGDPNTGYAAGVSITGRTGIAIRNLTISGFGYGILVDSSSNIEIAKNRFLHQFMGLGVFGPGQGNSITGNVLSGFATLEINSDNNAVAGNSFILSGDNVMLYGDHNTFDQNFFDDSTESIQGSGEANVITRGLFESHIHLVMAHNTIISGNTLHGGIYHMPPPPASIPPFYWDYASQIYGNNFIGSRVWAGDYFAPWLQTSIFNQPAPTGGNYWGSFDEAVEGCSDIDSDGFCDSPYNFFYGKDNLPWVSPAGCERPAIGISTTGIYWGSFSDYQARLLTVDFSIVNSGSSGAYDINIIGSRSDGDVLLAPATGYFLQRQTLVAGGTTEMSLKYQVPVGTTRFRTTTYATAKGLCGDIYEFPGPMPVGTDAVQF